MTTTFSNKKTLVPFTPFRVENAQRNPSTPGSKLNENWYKKQNSYSRYRR